jgi:hypothetical protein
VLLLLIPMLHAELALVFEASCRRHIEQLLVLPVKDTVVVVVVMAGAALLPRVRVVVTVPVQVAAFLLVLHARLHGEQVLPPVVQGIEVALPM